MNQGYDQTQSIILYRITVQGNSEGLYSSGFLARRLVLESCILQRVWGRVRCARRIRRTREEVDFKIRNLDGLLRVSGKVGRRS